MAQRPPRPPLIARSVPLYVSLPSISRQLSQAGILTGQVGISLSVRERRGPTARRPNTRAYPAG
eukprot:4445234-Pyramimonas_sp.AAC.1